MPSEKMAAQREIINTFLATGLDPHLQNSQGKTVAASARSAWIQDLLR